MLDLDIPPEVAEEGTDGGVDAVRRIVVEVVLPDVTGTANNNTAEASIPPPWITVTARHYPATARALDGSGPVSLLRMRRRILTPFPS